MSTSFKNHLLDPDAHASRPAAGDVPQGTLFPCTTHGTLEQSDGSSTWTDWFGPLASAGDILDLPTTETDTSLVLAPDGAGGVEFRAETGGGGGSSIVVVQTKQSGVNGSSLVLDAAPTNGNRLILGINRLGTSTTTSVTQTGVTWTMLLQYVTGGSCYEIWVGVVGSGASATINYTAGSSNFNSVRAIEINGVALTPTAGVTSATATNGGRLTGITPGNYVIGLGGNVNTGITANFLSANPGRYGVDVGVVPLWIVPSPGTTVVADGASNSACLLAEVS